MFLSVQASERSAAKLITALSRLQCRAAAGAGMCAGSQESRAPRACARLQLEREALDDTPGEYLQTPGMCGSHAGLSASKLYHNRLEFGLASMGEHQACHACAQMKAEEEIVRRLAAPFGVEFHPAACAGLRSCDPACDTADYQAADPDACRKR